jgi:predicted Holliday junction resolvase-like endonuclease
MAQGTWGYTQMNEAWKGQATALQVLATQRAIIESLKKNVEQHKQELPLANRARPKMRRCANAKQRQKERSLSMRPW